MPRIIKIEITDEHFDILEQLAKERRWKPGVYIKDIVEDHLEMHIAARGTRLFSGADRQEHGGPLSAALPPPTPSPRPAPRVRVQRPNSTAPVPHIPPTGISADIAEAIAAAVPAAPQPPVHAVNPYEGPIHTIPPSLETPPAGWTYDHGQEVWRDANGSPHEYAYQRFGTPEAP